MLLQYLDGCSDTVSSSIMYYVLLCFLFLFKKWIENGNKEHFLKGEIEQEQENINTLLMYQET